MTKETLAGRLAALREAAGLSRYALAKRCGLTVQAVVNLEAGASPNWETVRALAAALGVPVTAFEVGAVHLPEVKPRGRPGRKPKGGDQPPETTPEDEAALDRANDAVGREEAERLKAAGKRRKRK